MNRSTKVLLSVFALLTSTIVLINEVIIPTDSYRNIFFFADVFTYNTIMETGHISAIEQMTSTDGVSTLQYYTKIISRSESPGYGIILAIYKYVLGTSPSVLYAKFPGFLLSFGIFSLLSYKITDSDNISIIIGIVGMLAPTIQPIYSMNFNSALSVMFLTGVYMIFLYLESTSKKKQIFSIVSLFLMVLALFSWYPPRSFILTIIILSVGLLYLMIGTVKNDVRTNPGLLFVGVCCAIIIGYDTFFISQLQTFINLLRRIALTIASGQIPSVQFISVNTGTSTKVISSQGYAWISAIPLLAIGSLGGILCLKRTALNNNNIDYISLVLVGWGMAILLIITAYLFTGVDWIVGRSLSLSENIIIFGSAVGLKWIKDHNELALILLLCLLLITTPPVYMHRASSDIVSLQTYSFESDQYGEWSSEYLNGIVVGDKKTGSPLIGNGYKSYIYPQSISAMNSIFYSKNMTEYRNQVCEYNSKYHVITEEQKETGIYVMSRPRIPMTEDAYQARIEENNIAYTNGEHTILSTYEDC